MANNKIIPTIFQNLDRTFSGNWDMAKPNSNSYDIKSDNDILYKTDNKEKYEKTKLELQQNNYLANRWQKANVDLSLQAFNGLNNVKLMYRDVDLMDSFPEIGAALDIVSEEAAQLSDKGQIINVYSQSERIKSVLEDLFINRLDLHATAQMVIRGMCKYGNQFMLLNIDNKLGITGWRQLPVFNMERVEHGIENPYSSKGALAQGDKTDMQTKFIWMDEANQAVPFRNWQIGHFRLINNSMYLPYGVSYLNNARRHWRLLSLMEDMMMIYRLERSMERRVYKIFVGAIDDADIPAYVQEVANNFKRTPIIDPLTGQLDLRKNILPVWKKTPIPLLDGRTITIEELSKEFKEGKENFVYSVQDNTKQIVPGKVVWCGKNYEAKNMIKVTLDDDTYCVMAPEHEVLMMDGSKKRADMLSVNDSVMPFYTKLDKKSEHLFDRYEKVYNPNSGKFEPTHRLVAQDLPKEIETYNTVHHKDFDKYNNNPTNLLWCDYHKIYGDLDRKDLNDPIKRSQKVKSIEVINGDDVYCMTVVGLNGEEDRHNFALRTFNEDESWCENGIFVSNCVDNDVFIPTRDANAPTPIDTLPAAQNLTAIDDIKFIQKKVLAALRIPRAFLNFDESTGEGKNLALLDIRFARTINRIQQAFLMELTKIATIHLYILGFEDELTNFSLSMNNPSTQAEGLEIENIQKKIQAIRDAVADPGGGIPIMSLQRALRQIMKFSDKDIQENLEEIRLERALASELEKTSQIIQRTKIFDSVDRMYGEPNAEYQDGQEQGQGMDGGMPMGGGGGMPMGDIGGDIPTEGEGELGGLGELGSEEGGDIQGSQGEVPMTDNGESEAPMESVSKNKPLLTETITKFVKRNKQVQRPKILNESLIINDEFDKMLKSLDNITE